MLVQGNEVYNLIPQRPPMVMVDTLFDCSEEKAVTGLKILPENIFVKNERFTESGLIENIAQSAALMTGWQAKTNTEGEQKISLGVIGAVKDFQLHFLPELNSQITTEIEVLYKIANATIVNGKVKVGDALAAECELKIFTAEQL
jgi:3-hydroxymyristoyl/3-hydroxydecanoyl-(acyl carrier protein) dehydratase